MSQRGLCKGGCGLEARYAGLRWFVSPTEAPTERCPVCSAPKRNWVTKMDDAIDTARESLEWQLQCARKQGDRAAPRRLSCGHVCRGEGAYQASVGGGGPLAALILGIGFYSALGSDQRCCCCTGSSASCSECVPRKFEQTLRGRGVPAAVAAHLADVVLTDVMGRSVHVSGADNAARVQRLQDHQRTLYHQTDPAAAAAIVASQRFLRGSSGLAGGGIYFAESPKETMHKAHNHGTILKATVLLGRQLSINPDGDRSINFQSLLQAGYDSVLIPRPGGTEHVVYNYDQVKDIRQA
jgi:hypothetical protein